MKNLRIAFFAALLGLGLSGCSGGGGGPTPSPVVPVRPDSPDHSLVSVDSSSIRSGQTTQVHVVTYDANGKLRAAGGATVVFQFTGGGSTGTLSPTVDLGNGTYSATLTGVLAGTPSQITATLEGRPIKTPPPSASVTPGPVSITRSKLTVNGVGILALPHQVISGKKAPITIVLEDDNGNLIGTGGDTVTLDLKTGVPLAPATLAEISGSAVTDLGTGSYTAEVTGKKAGLYNMTANWTSADGTRSGTLTTAQTIQVIPGAAVAAQSTFEVAPPLAPAAASPISILADNTGTHGVSVLFTLLDAEGNPIIGKKTEITLSTSTGDGESTGKFGDIQEQGKGVYESLFSGRKAGTATTLYAEWKGSDGATFKKQLNQTVQVAPGPASIHTTTVAFAVDHSPIAAEVAAAPAGAIKQIKAGTPHTIEIHLKDDCGNDTIIDNVQLSFTVSTAEGSSSGDFDLVSGSTHLRSVPFTGKKAGTVAHIQAKIQGSLVVSSPQFQVSAGDPIVTGSTLSISPLSRSPYYLLTAGSGSLPLEIRLVDRYGNPVSGAQGQITLEANFPVGRPAGSFSPVFPKSGQPGDYTVRFTAGRTAESSPIPIFAIWNGSTRIPRTETGPVTIVPGPPSDAQSTLTITPSSTVVAGATAQITLRLADKLGNSIPKADRDISFDMIEGESRGTFSTVTHAADSYQVEFTGITAGAPARLRALHRGNPVVTTPVTVTPGALDPSKTRLTLSGTTVKAGLTITASLNFSDAYGNGITLASAPTFNAEPGNGLSTGAYRGTPTETKGVYSIQFEGRKVGSPIQLTAVAETGPYTSEQTLTVQPGDVSFEHSIFEVENKAAQVAENRKVKVLLLLRDQFENLISDSTQRVQFSISPAPQAGESNGTFDDGDLVPYSNGEYATFFKGTRSGTPVSLIARVNGALFPAQPKIEVIMQALFGMKRDARPLPAVQVRGRWEKQVTRFEDEPHTPAHLTACTASYQGAIANAQPIFDRELADTAPCWSSHQKTEVQALIRNVKQRLDELTAKNHADPHYPVTLAQVGRDYQTLQEHLSYCRSRQVTHGQLVGSSATQLARSPFNTDDKALLHVLGDVFGKKSGLEGQNTQATIGLLEKRVATLIALRDHLNRNPFVPSSLQACPCAKIPEGYLPEKEGHARVPVDFSQPTLSSIIAKEEAAIRLTYALNDSFSRFLEEYNKQFSALSPGQSFSFVGGSTDHAFIYQVYQEAAPSPHYGMRIYNSGDGIQLHPKVQIGTRSRSFPWLEQRSVSKAKITNPIILKAIQDLQSSRNSKAGFAYDVIFQELGGITTSGSNRPFALSEYLKPQTIGNCSYAATPFALESQWKENKLGDLKEGEVYGSFIEYFVRSRILDSYFELNRHRLSTEPTVFLLLDKTLTFYSESINRSLAERGPIDLGMARESMERIQKYRGEMSTVIHQIQNDRIAAAQAADPTNPDRWRARLTEVVQSSGRLRKPYPIRADRSPKTPFVTLDLTSWVPHSNTLVAELANFIEQMRPKEADSEADLAILRYRHEDHSRDIQKIMMGVQDIAQKTSLQLVDSISSQDELSTFLGHLNDLGQLYVWALVHKNSAKLDTAEEKDAIEGLSPYAILSQIKLLTLAAKTVRRLTNLTMAELPSLYQPIFDAFIFGKTPNGRHWTSSFILPDSQWEATWQELIQYWQDERATAGSRERIFEWERYPLYIKSRWIAAPEREFRLDANAYSQHWSSPWGGYGYTPSGWSDVLFAQRHCRTTHFDTVLRSLEPAPSYYSEASQSYVAKTCVLPREFFEVRDISATTHFILFGSLQPVILRATRMSAMMWPRNHTDRISKPFSFTYRSPTIHTPIHNVRAQHYSFFGSTGTTNNDLDDPRHRMRKLYRDHSNESYYISDPTFGMDVWRQKASLGLWSAVLDEKTPLTMPSENRIEIPYNRRLSSRDIIALEQITTQVPIKDDPVAMKTVAAVELELQRDLLNLGSPSKTLAYFSEHADSLIEKRWQILFKSLMFQPQLLREEIRKVPHFPQLLSNFLWSNYSKRLKDKDYRIAAFFLRMHNLLEEMGLDADIAPPGNRLAHHELRGILRQLTESVSDLKNSILRDLLRTYRYRKLEKLTNDEVALFIIATTYRNLNPIADLTFYDSEEEMDVDGILTYKATELNRAIGTRLQVLSTAVGYFHPEIKGAGNQWHEVSPGIYTITAGHPPVSIDVIRGQILYNQQELRMLPGTISQHEVFKKHIAWNPKENPYAVYLGEGKYLLNQQPDGIPTRIDSSNGFTIEKRWGSSWYQLLDDMQVNYLATAKQAEWGVFPGYDNWQWVETEPGVPADPYYVQRSTRGGYSFARWDTAAEKQTEVLSFDAKTKQLFAVSRSDGHESIVQKVTHDRGVDSKPFIHGITLAPVAKDSGPLSFLTRIELPRFVWAWKDADGNLLEVDLPRFGISFKPTATKDKLESTELEHYSISRNQELHPRNPALGLGSYPHYLLVEKEDKVRILLPRINFAPRQHESGLVVHFDMNWMDRSKEEALRRPGDIHKFARKSQRLFVLPLDPDTGEIKTQDQEDKFYLALIHLWTRSGEYRSYEAAWDLIYGARSDMGDFRADPKHAPITGAREILDWIFLIGNNDHDPRALALRLGAGLLELENDLSTHRLVPKTLDLPGIKREVTVPEFFSTYMKELFSLHKQFLQTRSKTSTRWLPEDLEKLFLSVVQEIWSDKTHPPDEHYSFVSRLAELEGTHIPQALFEDGPTLGAAADGFDPVRFVRAYVARDTAGSLFDGCLPLEKFYSFSLHFESLNSSTTSHSSDKTLRAALADHLRILEGDLPTQVEQLKELYLTTLRFAIRQAPVDRPKDRSELEESCRRSSKFLYWLAHGTASPDRRTIQSYQTISDLKRRLTNTVSHYDDREGYYREERRIDALSMHLQNAGRDPGLVRPSRETVRLPQPLPDSLQNPKSAKFWDPRESLPQPRVGVLYRYDRTQEPGLKLYDLTEVPILLKNEPPSPDGALPPSLFNFIEEKDLSTDEQRRIDAEKAALQRIFDAQPKSSDPTQPVDPFLGKKLQALKTDLNKDLNQKQYDWKNPSATDFAGFIEALSTRMDAARQRMATEKEKIEGILVSVPEDAWIRTKEIAFRSGGLEPDPSLRRTLQAFARRTLHELSKKDGTGLSPEKVNELTQSVYAYLIHSTYYFRLRSTQESLKSIQRHLPSRPPTQEELRSTFQMATQLRGYALGRPDQDTTDPEHQSSEDPAYLAFEYSMRGLIRKDQIATIRNLAKGSLTIPAQQRAASLNELIMGSGKTSVILPLASFAEAIPGLSLSVVVLPEALVPTMAKQLGEQLQGVFGIGVDRINIARKHKYNLFKLKYLYNRLRRDLDTGRVIVTSNSSIQSLFLIFIEALYDYRRLTPEEQGPRQAEIKVLQDIFSLFRTYGNLTIDEVDSILNILDSHRFSVGNRMTLEAPIVNASAGLFRILAENDQMHRAVKIPFGTTIYPYARPYSQAAYVEHILPLLIEEASKPEKASYFFDEPETIARFQALARGGEEGTNQIRRYLSARKSATDEATLAFIASGGLTNPVEWLKSDAIGTADDPIANTIRDTLSVMYTQIHQMLKSTLDRVYLIHFGLCPLEYQEQATEAQACHPFIAVPFHSGAPVVGSRHGTDIEGVNYLMQSHLEKRDIYSLFRLEMKKFKTEFKRAASAESRHRVRLRYMEYFDHTLTDPEIVNMSEDDVKKYAKDVSVKTPQVLRLVKTYAAPKLDIFPAQLFTNSYIYSFMFATVRGMSGTLWNADSYPELFKKRYPSDSTFRTLTALWSSRISRQVRIIPTPQVNQPVSETLQVLFPRDSRSQFHGLIDQGGIFRGQSNLDIALALRTLLSSVTQMIYYDDEDYTQILKEGETTPTVYRMDDTDRFITGAFWDMRHTTGSDLKIPLTAHAVLTLNKHSILRDLLQSAWRLRGLESGQHVAIVIPRDEWKLMAQLLRNSFVSSTLKVAPDDADQVPLEQILLYLATNEAHRVGDVNYRSSRAAQKAIVVDHVFNALVNEDLGEKLFASFDKVVHFFASQRDPVIHNQYGTPIGPEPTLDYLKRQIGKVFNPVTALFGDLVGEIKASITAALEAKSLFEKVHVPTSGSQEGEEEEVEVESELDKEEELKQELEQEKQLHEIGKDYAKAKVAWSEPNFILGSFSSTATLIPLHPLNPAQVSKLPSTLPFSQILERGSLRNNEGLFSGKLWGSLNLFPVFTTDYLPGDRPFVPFGLYQMPMDYVVVSLNKETGPNDYRVNSFTLVTRDEAIGPITPEADTVSLGDWLVQDWQQTPTRSSTSASPRILIYEFGNKFIRFSGNFWDDAGGTVPGVMAQFQKIEALPEFQELIVQVKFLTGRTYLTETEEPYLEQWISTLDPSAPRKLLDLSRKIFEYKDLSRPFFKGSPVHEALTRDRAAERRLEHRRSQQRPHRGSPRARSADRQPLPVAVPVM